MKGLAVTGASSLSAQGIGPAAFAAAFADPEAARARAFASPSTVLDPEKHPAARVAEVWGFDAKVHLGPRGHRNFDRLTKYLIAAAKGAIEQSGAKQKGELVAAFTPSRVGVCSSTAYGSLDSITELNLVAELEDPRYINPSRFPNTVINAAAGYVSIWEDLRAPNVTIVDGNCGALDAALTAETHLRHGRADAFLVGGGDVLTEVLYLAMQRLGALAEGEAPWAPGEAGSAGMRMGEAAAFLFVERAAGARSRGARILAELLGYGTSFAPPPHDAMLLNASAEPIAAALRGALRDAALEAGEVDLVLCSAGGLEDFDAAELAGIEEVLGAEVAVASLKELTGESFAGSGALSMAAAVELLNGASPPPLLRGRLPAEGAIRRVLVHSQGFYGNASALVIGAPEPSEAGA